MLEQSRWADQQGFDSIGFSEHHASEDGYLPSPLIAATAAAAVTSSARIKVAALLLPLYELPRLAEDLAIVDHISGGRLDLIVGVGYRPEEYALHGNPFANRFSALERGVEFLRRAWTGEPFEHDGRTVHVTPAPMRPGGPPIYMGGSSPGSARRAARVADGYFPVSDVFEQAYLDECAALGKQPGPCRGTKGPMFVHVSEDPDRDWASIAPHALHETNSYGRWLAAAGDVGPYAEAADADSLRASGNYLVLTPPECVELARAQGELTLHPLMGGLSPEIAARSLALVESRVLPELR
jgi:alkanesulfonate monooxygenase SsuD/methylene tetrahydromethanopterin reductase-like flavin-dependent oxidoreductase (luciferase family)